MATKPAILHIILSANRIAERIEVEYVVSCSESFQQKIVITSFLSLTPQQYIQQFHLMYSITLVHRYFKYSVQFQKQKDVHRHIA